MTPPTIEQRLDQITDQLNQITAALALQPSPWRRLDAAAAALGYPTPRALRAAINRGTIPPQFVRWNISPSGRRTGVRVDVAGFLSHLRQQ